MHIFSEKICDLLYPSYVSRLKLQMDGYQWSSPFAIGTEGFMSICLRRESGSDQMHISVEVRGGTKTSRYEVIFRPKSVSSPYR